jgi:hypothetical protein
MMYELVTCCMCVQLPCVHTRTLIKTLPLPLPQTHIHSPPRARTQTHSLPPRQTHLNVNGLHFIVARPNDFPAAVHRRHRLLPAHLDHHRAIIVRNGNGVRALHKEMRWLGLQLIGWLC